MNISLQSMSYGFLQQATNVDCYCSLKSEHIIMMDTLLQKIESDPLFNEILNVIDRDLSFVSFNNCFNQIEMYISIIWN